MNDASNRVVAWLGLSMASAGALVGQNQPGLEALADTNRRELAPGLRASATREIMDHLPCPSWTLEIDTSIGIASPDVRLAPQAPWLPEPLGEAARGLDSPVCFALVPEPAGEQDPWLHGLVFADGRLVGWPQTGIALTCTAEGTLKFLDPPEAPSGSITFDDGTEFPVGALNALPPPGTLGLVTGPFSQVLAPTALFPAGSLVLVVRPGPLNRQPARSIWDDAIQDEGRQWTPVGPYAPAELILGNDSLGIVILPGSPGTSASFADKHADLTIDLDLPTEIALSRWAMDAGRPFDLLDTSPEKAPAEGIRTVVATDDAGRRLWILESGNGDEMHPALADRKTADRLRKMGATHAVAMPSRGPRLMPGEVDGARTEALVKLKARATLGVAARAPEMTDSSGARMRRLVPVVVAASNLQQEAGGPAGLVDGRVGNDPSLSNFWAGSVSENGSMPWVEFRLLEPSRLGVVDVVHAENCGFSPSFDLKGYRLLVRRSASDRWKVAADVRNEEPVPRERIALPSGLGEAEWLRLEVTDPSFQKGCKTARLGELVLWGDAP